MINWSKYFDRIYCLNYNQNKIKKQLFQFQLNRIGILNSSITEWQITFNDKYTLYLKDLINVIKRTGWFSCTMGHLDIIKRAYHQGYKRILIVEDDVRFLKDLNKIQQILQNIPEDKDWDFLLFDKAPQCSQIQYSKIIRNKNNLLNKYYCKFSDDIVIHSTACYCLNKQGMKNLINAWDSGIFHNSDMFWNVISSFKKRRVASLTCIGLQCLFKQNESVGKFYLNTLQDTLLFLQSCYKKQEIRFDDYMMRKDGSPFNYGDWIEI